MNRPKMPVPASLSERRSVREVGRRSAWRSGRGVGRRSARGLARALVPAALVIALAGCVPVTQGARTAGGPSGPVGATVGSPAAALAEPSAAVTPSPSGTGISATVTKVSVAQDLATPFACPQPTVTVLDGRQLRDALRAARPGDVIGLEPGTYRGTFTIKKSGTTKRPVYLCGPADAVLTAHDQLSGYTLHLEGVSDWRLQGFSVRNGAKGIMLDASHRVVLQGLSVNGVGDEAVHLRRNSTRNVVQQLLIRKTGQVHPKFGEGIYVGSAKSNWCQITACKPDRSDHNQLLNNRIALTTAESIDIKEGTRFGVLAGNVFDGRGMVSSAADSWVDVKGNDWMVISNRGRTSPRDGFQVHVILHGWGRKNSFTKNTSELSVKAGTGIMLQHPAANVVRCDNVMAGVGHPYSGSCRN